MRYDKVIAALGIVTRRRVVSLYRASPITDVSGNAFRGHDELTRAWSIDRATLVGGFSLFLRERRLAGLGRRSMLNDPVVDYRLPMEWVDAIIDEIGLPRLASFRVFG